MTCVIIGQSHCIIRLIGEVAKLKARFIFTGFSGQLTRQQLKMSKEIVLLDIIYVHMLIVLTVYTGV